MPAPGREVEPGRCHGLDCSVNGYAILVRRHSFNDIVSRHCDLAGAVRRRTTRQCRGYGRFPYTGMTGGLTKIIAGANSFIGLS